MKTQKPACLTFILTALAFVPCHAATVFSFQQGDLRKDGVLFGSGASYSGTLDGSINDNVPTSSMTTITGDRVGNQFRSAAEQTNNPSLGTNGQQWIGLFTINLSELATFIAGNPSYSVSEASFSLTRTGGATSGVGLSLHQTVPFTSAATWVTYDGINAWPSPEDNAGGSVGGGTLSSGPLNGNSVGSLNSVMAFGTSTTFVEALEDALARADKTLYLLVAPNSRYNGDANAVFANNTNATVDSRPELAITLIPEPTAALLGGLGLLALMRRRR